MRLLNKTTLEFDWFLKEDVPPYTILSHRWHGDETTMKEFLEQRYLSSEQQSPGTAKVIRFCKEVATYDSDYVWIDTICIDKTSSTELQEAINSMYKWYEHAKVCVVFLNDVDTSAATKVEQQLAKSRWFTRGWTLQELLAPVNEVFLDVEWRRIGTRNELKDTLHEITGIRADCLGNKEKILAASVAERMSWLSLRQTTRTEDIAYCMLGIFDINMGMLYGEGHKAFIRLQKEIIREIDDESIFVWLPTADMGVQEPKSQVPVLAPSPECFSVCRGLEIQTEVIWWRKPCHSTSRGLEIELYDKRTWQAVSENFVVFLNCTVGGQCPYFEIQRTREAAMRGSNRWHRIAAKEIQTIDTGRASVLGPPMPMSRYSANPNFTGVGNHLQQVGPGHGFRQQESKEVFTVFIY